MKLDILVIDDEPDIRCLISDILKDNNFSPRTAPDSIETFKLINEKVPNVIILDIWLQGSPLDGLGILEIVNKQYPLLPIIIISGHGTIETAVTAIKMGAYDYLEKPFSYDKLLLMINRAHETNKLRRENLRLRSRVVDRTDFIGESQSMIKLRALFDKIAPTDTRVMLHGEIGSGKELAANLIHKKSKREDSPFIVFSPTGLSPSAVQEELFGIVQRRIKSALPKSRVSMMESAHNGTLYIDEVGDLPINSQEVLLDFLNDNTIVKNGKKIVLDVRIITGTSRNLDKDIKHGLFKENLYHRLNITSIRVPNLSEHKEDIPLLVKYFVSQLAKFNGIKPRNFSDEAIAVLQAYNWVGNVRQLCNVVEFALIMNPASQGDIKPDMLPQEITTSNVNFLGTKSNSDVLSMKLRDAREVFEREYLVAQMNRFSNNISKTADFIGMERSALHRKLKTLHIHSNYSNKEQQNNHILEKA